MTALASRAGTFSPQAAAVAIVTLAIIVAIARWLPRVPGAIVALCAGTAAAHFLGLGVETVGSRFGGIPSGLPHMAMPAFRASLIPTLLMPAITVGLLGAIESLMSAMVADKMSGDRHDSNMELVAQGVANLVSPMVGGPSRDGRDCADGHQHPVGRQDAGGRHRALADAARDPARRGAARRRHSDGGARGHPHGRVLQHGRVARDSRAAAAEQGGHRRVARRRSR